MELYELLEQVVGVFDRLAIPYFVTGSVASMSYGEPRLTNDIDLVAGCGSSTSQDYWPRFHPMPIM